jgi:hypothetical protein
VRATPEPDGLTGLVFGLLLSLPDAIVTKAYAPILVVGAIGGLSSVGFCTAGSKAARESPSPATCRSFWLKSISKAVPKE